MLFVLKPNLNLNLNQNRGKITLIIFPVGRVNLAISLRSGSFQLKKWQTKK